jgi:hypothetical protein
MALSLPTSGWQLRSLIRKSGELEVSLATVDVLPPAPNEGLVFLCCCHSCSAKNYDIKPNFLPGMREYKPEILDVAEIKTVRYVHSSSD